MAFRRSELAAFPRVREIRDWSAGAHQDQLPKFLQLLDGLLQHIRNAINCRRPNATLLTRQRIRAKKLGARGISNAPGRRQSVSIKRVPAEQDCSSRT